MAGVKALVTFALVVLCTTVALAWGAQKQRVAVKGAVDSGGFSDKGLDETAKHIRERLTIVSLFTAAKSEEEADLLVVVAQRSDEHREKSITVNVSTKDGADWKPATKITDVCDCAWTLTAEKIVYSLAKWTRARKK